MMLVESGLVMVGRLEHWTRCHCWGTLGLARLDYDYLARLELGED